uniref:Cytochrome c oxidase assembly factor 3 n=1 Tax=Cynoglossus semilaevis TaxID=244447 RepID=A0A3P8VDS5_CYNSE
MTRGAQRRMCSASFRFYHCRTANITPTSMGENLHSWIDDQGLVLRNQKRRGLIWMLRSTFPVVAAVPFQLRSDKHRDEPLTERADKTPTESDAPFATRIDPSKEGLSPQQLHFIRQVERAQLQKRTQKLHGRNAAMGLAVGAVVLGIYGYTIYSVSQEKIVDELDEEAKRLRSQQLKTGAN